MPPALMTTWLYFIASLDWDAWKISKHFLRLIKESERYNTAVRLYSYTCVKQSRESSRNDDDEDGIRFVPDASWRDL